MQRYGLVAKLVNEVAPPVPLQARWQQRIESTLSGRCTPRLTWVSGNSVDYVLYGLRTEEKGKGMLRYVGASEIWEKSADDINRVA